MSDAKKRMHAGDAKPEAVAPKSCAECAELRARIAELEKALRTLQR